MMTVPGVSSFEGIDEVYAVAFGSSIEVVVTKRRGLPMTTVPGELPDGLTVLVYAAASSERTDVIVV
jgi:hypothetical protein